MSVTVKELKQWIEDSGFTDETVVVVDGDGALVGDVPGKAAVGYLHVGFIACDEVEEEEADAIEGFPGGVGEIVFWDGPRPWWIVEWQPHNGRVFVIVNADGTVGTAGADELTRDFRNARKK